MSSTRQHKIEHQITMLFAAAKALEEMKETPDIPTDVSHVSVGALSVLKKAADVQVLFSHDSAFALMDILPEDEAPEEWDDD